MADVRYQVRIADDNGVFRGFSLANDPKTGAPMFSSEILTSVQQATQTVGEVGYANFLPHINGVYNQPDISDGMGVKYQRPSTDALAKHYYYSDWLDASVPGQIQKGANVTTLTAPLNSGPMSGYFELGGVPHLCLGRIIAKYVIATDTLSQVRDLGAGGVNGGAAVFNRDGTETAGDLSSGTGAADRVDSGDKRLAQSIRFNTSGIQYIGRIDLQLQKVGLATPGAPVITTSGTAGASTWTYKVSATIAGGETPVGAAASTTTGNATLTASNFNVVTWTQVPGATGYKIYRTAAATSPTSTGYIGATTSSLTTFNDTGIAGDASTPNVTDTSAQIAGDVRLTIQADLNGRPSGQILSSSSLLAIDLSTSAATASFRFDDDDTYAAVFNEPFWLVLDVASAGTNQYVNWTRSTTDTYTRGTGAVSTDRGNSWTNNASSTDYFFTLYTKAATETAFVAADDGTNLLATTTDGSVYTADAYRSSSLMCTVGDRIVRDVRAGSQRGCIQYSTDGSNWSESLPVGDINTAITGLLALGKSLIVCKTDSIWAVDIVDATITAVNMVQLYYSNPISANGQGACTWKGVAYIPFSGRLVAVEGDFIFGWQVHQNIGPESLDDWDAPWGQGRIVACAPSRFHLYAIMSTTGAYKLFKSADPVAKKWHGGIAEIGDGTQTITMARVFDPGGTGNPRLFCSTTSNNVAEVVLSRFVNPASDPLYPYDNSHTGKLFYPRAHANFHVNPKAWISESLTFQKQTAADYVDMLYDTLDGDGFRRLGRVYTTDILPYPTGVTGLLLDRQMNMINSLTTTSPIILASALTYAVRNSAKVPLKQITFSCDLEDFQSAGELGDVLGLSDRTGEALTQGTVIAGGTRSVLGPDGELYQSVLFRNAKRSLTEVKQEGANRWLIEVIGVQVG